MNKTIDQKIQKVLDEMKTLGLNAFEEKQRETNPLFYQSGPNEMPDLKQISKTYQARKK